MVTEAVKAKDNSTSSEDMGWVVPCWLCGELIPVKFTKKNKPFLICNNCGVQTFIRYGKAEELLMLRSNNTKRVGKMGKERFLRELSLSSAVVEPGEAISEPIRSDGENENNKLSLPSEENNDILEAKLETPQLTEESAKCPTDQSLAKGPITKPSEQHVEVEKDQDTPTLIEEIKAEAEARELVSAEAKALGDASEKGFGDSAGDQTAPESTMFQGSKAAGEFEPERVTLAATILPLRLLGTPKAWWIAALFCLAIAIASYFLWRSHSRKDEVVSPMEELPKRSSSDPVKDFLNNY